MRKSNSEVAGRIERGVGFFFSSFIRSTVGHFLLVKVRHEPAPSAHRRLSGSISSRMRGVGTRAVSLAVGSTVSQKKTVGQVRAEMKKGIEVRGGRPCQCWPAPRGLRSLRVVPAGITARGCLSVH